MDIADLPPAEQLRIIAPVAMKISQESFGIFQYEDLLSWGWLGLLRATETFKSEKGIPFPQYAQYKVRWAIIDSIRTYNGTRRLGSDGQRNSVKLFPLVPDDESDWYEGLLSDPAADSAYDDVELRLDLEEAILTLRPVVRKVVTDRLHDKRFQEIGEEMGVVESRACQLNTEGVKALKRRLVA